MPTRDIKTKLSITGESEYKSALSRINSELKNLQSALKLTASEFQTQANTVDALKAKQEALTALQEKQAQKVKVYADALGQLEKDLERPSSTRLEARFPSHGSGAVTRSQIGRASCRERV